MNKSLFSIEAKTAHHFVQQRVEGGQKKADDRVHYKENTVDPSRTPSPSGRDAKGVLIGRPLRLLRWKLMSRRVVHEFGKGNQSEIDALGQRSQSFAISSLSCALSMRWSEISPLCLYGNQERKKRLFWSIASCSGASVRPVSRILDAMTTIMNDHSRMTSFEPSTLFFLLHVNTTYGNYAVMYVSIYVRMACM